MTSNIRAAVLASLAAIALAGCAATPTITPASSATKTVVVSATGSDSAAGTMGAPLRTIQKAIDRVAAGGTVDIRGGRYFQKIVLHGTSGDHRAGAPPRARDPRRNAIHARRRPVCNR